jgi:PKD repeat protein
MKSKITDLVTRLSVMATLLVMLGFQSANAQCGTSFTLTYDSTGTILNFTPVTPNGNPVSYLWDFGDNTTATVASPTHSYNTVGVVTVCLTVSYASGCTDTYCDSVLTRAMQGCQAYYSYVSSPNGVSFTDLSASSDPNLTYYWDYGNGAFSTLQNPTYNFVNASNFVCLTITSASGCVDTYCDWVYTQNSQNCGAGIGYTTAGGNTVNFTDTSYADTTITSYFWSFGDSTYSSLANPVHTFPAQGTYLVCLSITTASGCQSTQCQNVTVGNVPACQAAFTWSANPATNDLEFFDQSTTIDSIISYDWDFGDNTTSNQANPSHHYNAPGYYNVCLTISTFGGCSTVSCNQVYNPPIVVCSGGFSVAAQGNFAGFYADYISQSATYVWDFGDGNTITQVGSSAYTYQYANPGTYVACLNVYDSLCQSASCDTIVIGGNAACAALFTYTYDSISGDFTFINLSSPGTNYFWTFGDSTYSFDRDPVHGYNHNPGPFNVCLTMTDSASNCSDTYCAVVSDVNACNPVFSALPDSTNPVGVPMSFNVYSPCGAPTSIFVDFGDGTVQQVNGNNFTYTYANPGSYNVCVCEVIGNDTICVCDTVVAYRLTNGVAENELANLQLNAYPNPFSSELNVEYTLEKSASVAIQLIGIAGNVVSTTTVESQVAGKYHATVKSDALAPGFYFLHVTINGQSISKKVVLQK